MRILIACAIIFTLLAIHNCMDSNPEPAHPGEGYFQEIIYDNGVKTNGCDWWGDMMYVGETIPHLELAEINSRFAKLGFHNPVIRATGSCHSPNTLWEIEVATFNERYQIMVHHSTAAVDLGVAADRLVRYLEEKQIK